MQDTDENRTKRSLSTIKYNNDECNVQSLFQNSIPTVINCHLTVTNFNGRCTKNEAYYYFSTIFNSFEEPSYTLMYFILSSFVCAILYDHNVVSFLGQGKNEIDR